MSKEVGDEAEEGDGFKSEVCYSIPQKVQFKEDVRMQGRRSKRSGGQGGREKGR